MSKLIKSTPGFVLILGALVVSHINCTKEPVEIASASSNQSFLTSKKEPVAALAVLPNLTGYTNYLIKKGQHDASPRPFKTVNITEQKFKVVFDSSAIYTTVTPSNQGDINKLYGFSDNNSFHQTYSARIGWRWYNNKLSLFAYNYNKSVVSMAELGSVAIGVENTCSIKVAGSSYIFTLNGVTKSMPRSSTTTTGKGYQLYPYFGGDENAPHAVNIWIKPI